MDADDTYWDPFHQRFAFRPGMRSWPAIDEPRPSVTVDLGPIFAGSHSQFAAGADAINSLALVALTRVLGPDTSVVVLDWQHQTYRFWPHRFACQLDKQWPTTVFPSRAGFPSSAATCSKSQHCSPGAEGRPLHTVEQRRTLSVRRALRGR
jgi:hypothetical protein